MEHLVNSIENYVINMLQQRFGNTRHDENARSIKKVSHHHRRLSSDDHDESRPIAMTNTDTQRRHQSRVMPRIGSVGFDSQESDGEFSSTEYDDNDHFISMSQKKKLVKRNRKKVSDYQELIFGMDMDLM